MRITKNAIRKWTFNMWALKWRWAWTVRVRVPKLYVGSLDRIFDESISTADNLLIGNCRNGSRDGDNGAHRSMLCAHASIGLLFSKGMWYNFFWGMCTYAQYITCTFYTVFFKIYSMEYQKRRIKRWWT